jgi:hypothetical protein
MTKSGDMRWVGHIARIREENNAYKFMVGKHDGMNLVEGLGTEGG